MSSQTFDDWLDENREVLELAYNYAMNVIPKAERPTFEKWALEQYNAMQNPIGE